jgi:hypothetical protein
VAVEQTGFKSPPHYLYASAGEFDELERRAKATAITRTTRSIYEGEWLVIR